METLHMARHSPALKAVEPPADTGTVDDARQVDIEDAVAVDMGAPKNTNPVS